MSSDDKDTDPGRRDLSPQDREALKRRAADLGKRLEDVKARKTPVRGPDGARGRAFGEAFKIVAELIVGVAVGGGLGWVMDRQLGTTPWLLIVCLMLGFAAGLSNVIRTARRMQAGAEPMQRAARSVADDDDDDDAPAGGVKDGSNDRKR